jgi:hypothetical protein
VPSSAWRAAEILTAVEAAGIGEAGELREVYETSFTIRQQTEA